jgi:diguanylate cyclase (GGDEF)-like protein
MFRNEAAKERPYPKRLMQSLRKLHRQGLVTVGACLMLMAVAGYAWIRESGMDFSAPTTLLYLGIMAIGAAWQLGALLRLQRRALVLLRHDVKSLVRLAKDARRGSLRVDYPVALAELAEAFEAMHKSGRRLVRENEALKDIGLIDHLSQLGNRRHFETRLKEIHEAMPTHGPSSVLIIDVDKFKQVNDQHGHDAGDALIVAFANALRANVRQTDVLARLGGDEFCIIYPYTPLDKARALVERLRKQLPRDVELTRGIRHTLRWTGGLSAMHAGDAASEDVLWRADQALLKAKEAGRNLTLGFDPVRGPEEVRRVMSC